MGHSGKEGCMHDMKITLALRAGQDLNKRRGAEEMDTRSEAYHGQGLGCKNVKDTIWELVVESKI